MVLDVSKSRLVYDFYGLASLPMRKIKIVIKIREVS
jgi:hypothetical protein